MQSETIEGFQLSPQQKRLWSLSRHAEQQLYRAQCLVSIQGRLEVARLRAAVAQVVQRHEILRTSFSSLQGMTIPLQVIHDNGHFKFSERSANESIERLWNEARQADLQQLEISLVALAEDQHLLLVSLPAIHADADGLRNLVADISRCYDTATRGEALDDEVLQYADVSEWQNELLHAENREAGRLHWARQDFSSLATLKLPYEQKASEAATPELVRHELDHVHELQALANKYETSTSVFLLTCWHILLSRLTARTSTIIGVAVNGRKYEEMKPALGLLTRYVPINCELEPESRFADLLQQQRDRLQQANVWQENFNWDNFTESFIEAPFFPFGFDYTEQPPSYVADEVSFTIEKEYVCTERFHVRLSCLRSTKGVTAEFHYDPQLYAASDIERLSAEFQTLINSVLDGEDASIAKLEIVGETERKQLLDEWNNTTTAYPSTKCIQELFEQQAAQTPKAVALVHEGRQLTYEELNRRANQLAHHLRSKGVGPEMHVAICMERSLEMIVGLLGILKAGGAYVPLEPTYPQERLALVLAETQTPVLVTQQHLVAGLPPHQAAVVCLDNEWDGNGENPTLLGHAENLAYVIYTSGSSGRPKGVCVTHRNLVHSTVARSVYYQQPPSSFLLLSSFAFDSSIAGIFWTLCSGGTLVLPAEGLQRDPQALVRLVREQSVSHLLSLPSLHALMLDAAKKSELSTLQVVIVAGEECAAELVERHFDVMPTTRLYNEYGPTEASVWSSVHECERHEIVSIGRPIPNARIYILDEDMRVVPIGVAGEIYIGGAGVARGYYGRPEETAARYLPDSFGGESEARMYRTGDRARYRANGEIEFLGRVDNQVKIRGYRIELGEIEAVLREHSAVRESVVIATDDRVGGKRLVAYLVLDHPAETREVRDFLKQRLPEHMVPSAFVVLEELLLMPNGKVDRQRLPEPEMVSEGELSAPRTPVEEVLAGIWSEVLGVKDLSVTANFFELGGHSLLATQVMSRVREALQVELPVRSLFAQPTVRGLATEIEAQLQEFDGVKLPPLRRGLREGELPLSYAQQRLWFADQLTPGSALYNVAAAVTLIGPLQVSALERTLAEIMRRHEVLRTSFPARQGEPVQVIAEQVEFELPVTDLSESEDKEQAARRLAEEEAQQPFDLAVGPLVRARLLRLSEAEHVALFTMHHIVSDGWSIGVLIKEVSQLYEAYSRGEESPLPTLPIQYADYAVWQREWLQGEVLAKQLGYWREQLAGAPDTLALPTDRPRPAVQSFRGGQQRFELPLELSKQLKELSRQESSSLFMTLLAAFKVLLHYYSGQTDIVVGVDIANRHRVEVEKLIGFFINILLMRTDLSANPTLRELLASVRETTLAAYAHQDLPFERLVEELQPERSLSGMPLVQTMFSFHNAPQSELKLSDLTLKPFASDGNTAKRDLTLFMTETDQGLRGTWNYNSNLFNASTIHHLSAQFELLLNKMVSEADVRLNDIVEILVEARKEQTAMEKKGRRDSRLSQFMNIAPQAVNLAQVNLTTTEYFDSQQLPLVIRPALDDVDLIEWARNHRESIETQLLEHGAILFRGFNTESATDFEQFALRICPELFGEYGDLPREGVSGKVYGSTPYPPEQPILFHNESSHLHRWPMKIWFFCMHAAQQGGETPVVDCRKVYEALDPKLRERFTTKKLMYVRNYVEGLDVSWQQFFRTTDKSVVEDYCRKASIACEWKNGDGLRTRQICHAVLQHPKTGQPVFFNQLQAHHVSCLQPETRASLLSLLKEEDLPRNVYYGDGTPIEDSVVDEIREIYQQLAINFPWQERDILMLDNMLTAHGRNPYVGERKIVVAMGEMITNQNVSFNGNGKRNAAAND